MAQSRAAELLQWATRPEHVVHLHEEPKTDELRKRLTTYIKHVNAPTVVRGAARVGSGREDERAVLHLLGRCGVRLASDDDEDDDAVESAILTLLKDGPTDAPYGVKVGHLLHVLHLANSYGATICVIDTRAKPTILGSGARFIGLLRGHRVGQPATWRVLRLGDPATPLKMPHSMEPLEATKLLLDQPRERSALSQPGAFRGLKEEAKELLMISMYVTISVQVGLQ